MTVTLTLALALPVGAETLRSYMLQQRLNAVHGDSAARVFGGRKAAAGAWPAQVALIGRVPAGPDQPQEEFYQFCGGSLIAPDWVLTAAHCVFDADGSVTAASDILVQSGSTVLGQGHQGAVIKVIPHPAYDAETIDNDLALLKLAEPVAAPVMALPAADAPEPLGPGVLLGWGFMEDGQLPADLMETDLDIVPNAACNQGMQAQTKRDIGSFLLTVGKQNRIPMDALEQAYSIMADNLGPALTDNMLCAGVASGKRTSCNGDSGGPLMVRYGGGWSQVGIVSWGRFPFGSDQHCGHPEVFGVYTRVSNYAGWIATTMQQN